MLENLRIKQKKIGTRFALAVTSGTSATLIALKALGVKRGDEVITQAFNFIATVEAIIEAGAKPVVVNVDETLNMCPKYLKKNISKYNGRTINFKKKQKISEINSFHALHDCKWVKAYSKIF